MLLQKYKSLVSKKFSPGQLKKFVHEADTKELIEMVLKVISTSESCNILDHLLQGFAELNESSRCNEKRYKLVKTIFETLLTAKVASKHADNIVQRIIIEFPLFERGHLVKLCDYFVERIRRNDDEYKSWKDVLPLLLERLEEEKSINCKGTELSGSEYKIKIINTINEIDWEMSILTPLVKMFVELMADVKDKKIGEHIMRALTSKLMSVELSEMPPLAHQLLKLTAENNSTLLFATLSKYFAHYYRLAADENNCQENSESIETGKVPLNEVQECESTVLYHVYQSALDNAKGCNEYMRCLKSVVNAPEYILDPFVMSVLLLLSNLYQEQALQILKNAFLRQIQDEESKSHNAWLRSVLSDELDAMVTINKVINNSNKDRQLVLKGMVDFGFMLLGIERKVSTESHPPWECGCKILQKIARKRSDAGGTILEILNDKIVSSGVNVIQYTNCLAYICRRLAMTVIEHRVWITTLMDQLLVIPGSAAALVLRAILPLMRISSSIRDSLIMILRKALYRKGTETRRMAVVGFLQLLKNLKLTTLTALSQSESLSSSNVASSASILTQANCEYSQRMTSNPWHNTSLCREILAILGKCFTHEMEVRTHLYEELYHGIVKNEELTEYVIEMLLEHFSRYYEKDQEVLPPIIFERCCSCQGIEVVLDEPLADLVFSLQKIYLKVAKKESARVDKLRIVLESLCKRMAQTEIENLGLNDDVDLLDGMPKNQQKLLNIKIAISVYEALIAYRIREWSVESEDVGRNLLNLFKGYHAIVEYAKKIGKSKKGKGKKDKEKDKDNNDTTGAAKKGRPTSFKLPNTVMDFDTIAKCIALLYNPCDANMTEEQQAWFKGRIEFYYYVFQTCLQLLNNIKSMKDHELTSYLELNKRNLFLIGKILYKHVICYLEHGVEFNESIVEQGFECFKECLEIMCTFYSNELESFLKEICDDQETRNFQDLLLDIIKPLKAIFLESFEIELSDEVKMLKIPMYLIEIISKLINKIPFNVVKIEEQFDWLIELAKTKENVSTPVTSIILQLILLINDRSVACCVLAQEICVDFGFVVGTLNKQEITATRSYLIINGENIYVCYVAVNKLMSSKLQNITLLLGRLNAEYVAATSLEANSEADQKKIKDKEANLCRKFVSILNTLEVLSNTKISPGQATDILFKNLQKAYNTACSLAKYFRKKSTPTNPAFQAVKFASVVQAASSALKEAVADMITHIESTQNAGKSNDANVQRNKILKEIMVIPGVVQAMDMFDKEITLLSKKTNVDLVKYTKNDIVRDFRIQGDKVIEKLERMNVSLLASQTVRENDENSDEEEQEEDESVDSGESVRKRPRKN